jgi:DNA-binding transcriptional LysR family regulator
VGRDFTKRVKDGIELAPAGSSFVKEAKVIVTQVETLDTQVSGAAAKRSVDELTMVKRMDPQPYYYHCWLSRFRKKYLEASLYLHTDNRPAIERLVLSHQVQLAVIKNATRNPRLTIEPYRAEPAVVFVSRAIAAKEFWRVSPGRS